MTNHTETSREQQLREDVNRLEAELAAVNALSSVPKEKRTELTERLRQLKLKAGI